MKRLVLILMTAALSFGVTAVAQVEDVDLEKLEGYIDLEQIEIPVDAKSVTDITLGPALLKLAEAFCCDEGEEIKAFGISSVRIKAFDLYRADVKKVRKAMESIAEQLKKDAWESLVTVTSEEEYVRIAIKFTANQPVGLMLLAMDEDDEAAFVNVAGENINFKHLTHIGMGHGWKWHKHLHGCF